jgi:hypothetical protein
MGGWVMEGVACRARRAATINKAQGQTRAHMGLYLRNPVSSHIQLCVALSRVGSRDRVRVLMKRRRHVGTACSPASVITPNMVYREDFNFNINIPIIEKGRLALFVVEERGFLPRRWLCRAWELKTRGPNALPPRASFAAARPGGDASAAPR